MPPAAKYVSEEGLEKLKQELNEFKTNKRKEIALRLEHAKSLGDLSENAEYQETKEEQSMIEGQIAELEDLIRSAIVIRKSSTSDQVEVGSSIKAKSERGEEFYTIVGSEEANPVEGRISNESPLGRAFLEHKVGDSVEVKTPKGVSKYQILEIK